MDLSISEKKLKPVRNPARIHSPDPFLRAGKSSRGFAKSFPPENSFGKTESALVPPPARILGGQNPKKKNVLSILEEIGRAQIRKARNIFLWCPPRLCEAVAGLVHSFSFRSKKVRAKCIITAPVVTCSELRIWSDFAEAKIAL